MKAKLLILVLLVFPFWSIGQIAINKGQKVEVWGIFETCVGYRDLDTARLNTDLFTGLFVENGEFYLRKTKVSFEEEFDECNSLIIYGLTPSEDNCMFLFYRFIGYNTKVIETIVGGKGIEMMPGKHYDFRYGNVDYTIQANGEIDEVNDSDIRNYTLSFCKTDSQIKQTLVTHELVESTVGCVLFIGDLDGDGEPDIILDAPTNYENRRIMLFLSSTKKENELLHIEAEKFDWFDC